MCLGRECLWVLVTDTKGWGKRGNLGPEDLQNPQQMEAERKDKAL